MQLIELSENNILKPLFDGKKDPIEIQKMLLYVHASVSTLEKCYLALVQPTALN